MRIAKVLSCFDIKELTQFPGDNDLRCKAFSPFFLNLYENKLVYKERFTAVVELSDLQVTPKGLSATATPIEWIHVPDYRKSFAESNESWTFSNSWGNMCLNVEENNLCSPYVGFTLWPERDQVEEAFSYAILDNMQAALFALHAPAGAINPFFENMD